MEDNQPYNWENSISVFHRPNLTNLDSIDSVPQCTQILSFDQKIAFGLMLHMISINWLARSFPDFPPLPPWNCQQI